MSSQQGTVNCQQVHKLLSQWDTFTCQVYTINQESKYLLFQGVPAMGTTQELIKLCALHGAVEEYRMLDDFPTTDQFTDVMLVKFKRIQSARHAKKKLDDWSFFGGVLQVSYAPEYESVEETREKLQDRRKAIAGRLRVLGKNTGSSKVTEHSQSNTADSSVPATKHSKERIQTRIPTLSDHGGESRFNQHANRQHSDHHRNSVTQTKSCDQNWTNYQKQETNYPSSSNYHDYQEPPQHTLVIPPPPMREHFPNYSNHNKHSRNFDFARVPTANAPYPPDFDARTNIQKDRNDSGYDNQRHGQWSINSHSYQESDKNHINLNNQNNNFTKNKSDVNSSIDKTKTDNSGNRIEDESHANKTANFIKSKQQNLNHPKYQKVIEHPGGKAEKIVVKNFEKKGSAPKFIPRQMLSVTKAKPNISAKKPEFNNDELGKELRKNAVVLGSEQGPALVPEEYKKPEQTPVEKAVNQSVSEIRKRISKFSSVPDQEVLRKKPKHD